jgi:hypothetical protein
MMTDEKHLGDKDTASEVTPIELPFRLVIPHQLLPTVCECSEEHDLDLPPSMGAWGSIDDLSPSM